MALTDFSIDTSGTPEDVQRRQKLAEALMQQGGDTSPAAGGRNGGWLTGINRALAGALGGYQAGQANQMALGQRQQDADIIKGYPGANPVASMGTVPQALSKAAPGPDTSGKIYSNDEPSPLDPPSGDDRKKMMATILGEADNEPQLGKNAVASVIRTRAVDGGYGGDTPSAVVSAPNQFEPWNTAEGRARMARALADPQRAATADAAIRSAYGEGGKVPEDPTEGMTHFYSPTGQAALGRSKPAWAGGESVTIGGHVFNSPDEGAIPQNAQAAQGALPTQTQVAQADPQAAQRQSLQAWAQRAAMSSNPQIRQMGIQELERVAKPEPVQSIGEGYIVRNGKVERAYEPEDKTPNSKLEYDAYVKDEKAAGRQPIPYGQFAGKVEAPAAANGDPSLVGEDFIKTIPDKGDADIVRGVLEGRIAPAQIGRQGSAYSNKILKLAMQAEPGFDASQWKGRQESVVDFSKGKSSEMVRSANQTIHHVGTLIENMKALDNSTFTPYNDVANYIDTKRGKAAPNNFTLNAHAVAEELSKVFKGANLSDSEIKVWEHGLSPSMSPEQQRGSIKTLMTLLHGSLSALEEKRVAGMGKTAAEKAGPLVRPDEQNTLDRAMAWANGEDTKEGGAAPKLEIGQSHKDGDVTITKIAH